jgi:hypothetical protein
MAPTRVVAIHDRCGNITSLVSWPADAPPVSVTLGPGEAVHEIDVPGLEEAADSTARAQILDRIVETCRVEVPAEAGVPARASLVQK